VHDLIALLKAGGTIILAIFFIVLVVVTIYAAVWVSVATIILTIGYIIFEEYRREV